MKPGTTTASWLAHRRPELLELFRKHIFGTFPESMVKSGFVVEESDSLAFCGRATRRQVKLWMAHGKDTVRAWLLVYLPNRTGRKVPVFLGMNFYGNHTVHPDPQIFLETDWIDNKPEFCIFQNKATNESRGVRSYRWHVERFLERGYGLATLYYGDLEPDYSKGISSGVRRLFMQNGQSEPGPEDGGSVAAWSFGLSRAMDYLVSDPGVRKDQVVVFGHSRLGKAALWAGAQDTRFALVISNNSGSTGAALSRGKQGETIKDINTRFPWWFCKNYHAFGNRESELPVDQHMLLALVAPRPLYVASAEQDAWADPAWEWQSLVESSVAWSLFGKESLSGKAMPSLNQPFTTSGLGYHIRSGIHDVTRFDLERFMDFADIVFGKSRPSEK